MSELGYSMSVAAYNEIENGLNIPRDAPRFLDVVAQCLLLSDDEKRDLERRMAYDILHARLGARADAIVPPDPSWAS
jgi:hypothetical protein